ncbi:uncharacterized protein TNCV_4638451 [Trichonephila clavipes]|uniref:Uncharacterized protein n=1 Tax=Trichonephila clavipes TaxID=2585209 RepID=A0A8X6WDB8_TRICX|nr:uncharacterized protein TNCV_4638451 [Trichonephila clavipes]
MPSPVQSICDAHDTIANGQYSAVWSMGHTQQLEEIPKGTIDDDTTDLRIIHGTEGEGNILQSPDSTHKTFRGLGAGGVVCNLVAIASDFRPKCLGSMLDATKYPRVHTEYVFVKSVGPKVLWTESRMQGTGEYFPSLQFHAKIVEGEIGGVTIFRPFGEFRRANSYCHLYGSQGQRQAYF